MSSSAFGENEKTDASPENLFRFKADGVSVSTVVEHVAAHFGSSVFVHADVADKKVSGTLVSGSLEDSLAVIAFMAGSGWSLRDGIFYVGGDEQVVIESVPRGAISIAPKEVFGEKVALSGDKLLIRSTQGELAQIRSVVEDLNEVASLHVQLVVMDVGLSDVEAWGEWLEALSAAAEIELSGNVRNVLPIQTGQSSAGTTSGALNTGGGYALNLRGVVELADSLDDSNVVVNTAVQIPSGSEVAFSAGEVVEREIFDQVPTAVSGGSTSFRSNFDRLPIGFDMVLRGRELPGGWFCQIEVTDSDFDSKRERKTSYKGDYILRSGDSSYHQIAALSRKEERKQKKYLKWLPFFKSQRKVSNQRRIFVFLRQLGESRL